MVDGTEMNNETDDDDDDDNNNNILMRSNRITQSVKYVDNVYLSVGTG
jgi:hypothetical protein